MKKNQLLETLGNTLIMSGQIDQAIEVYSDIVANEPKNTSGSVMLADLFSEKQDLDSAISTIRSAISFASNIKVEMELWTKLGNLYIANSDHAKAIKVFQKAGELSNGVSDQTQESTPVEIEINPAAQMTEDSPHIWNELGLILFKVGSYDDAADAYLNGLKLDPSLPFLHMNLAQVYVNQGKLDEAVAEFDTLLILAETNEEKSNIWTRILSCYKLQGDVEKVEITNRIISAIAKTANSRLSSYMNLSTDQIETSATAQFVNLDELVRSVRNHGVIQPLIVSKINNSEKFQLIAGNRRLAAAKLAGLTDVPVIVRNVSEVESIELSLHENLHNSIKGSEELATNFQKLATDFDYSIEEIAQRIGVSSFSVANSLKAPSCNRGAREVSMEDRSLEKDVIMKMIGRLGETETVEETPHDSFISDAPIAIDIRSEEAGLWYMETNMPVMSEALPTTKHTGLFARAAQMLSHNPHPAKLVA